MCSRVSQHRSEDAYRAHLSLSPWTASIDYQPSYNAAPGTQRLYLSVTDAGCASGLARWGYQGSATRMYVNAKVETAGSSYWRPLWEKGRVIIPVDGWYEWTGDKAERQPWFVHVPSFPPLWLPAILGRDGFVVITTTSDGQLSQLHTRRPIVLDAEGAQAWMSPQTGFRGALGIAAERMLPDASFAWYAVTRAMNNSRYQGNEAARPLKS